MELVYYVAVFVLGIGVGGLATILIVVNKERWFE